MDRTFTVTINGQEFRIVGNMAVTTSGQAYPLEDQSRSRWGR